MGTGGNVARGFEALINTQQSQQHHAGLFGGNSGSALNGSGASFSETERIFSHSSSTYRKVICIMWESVFY